MEIGLNMKKLSSKKFKSLEKEDQLFFGVFVGELVEILCRQQTTTEIGVFPLVVSGYLLDVDRKYLYLSDDCKNIIRAVKRVDHVTIEIVKEESQIDSLLNALPIGTPEDAN